MAQGHSPNRKLRLLTVSVHPAIFDDDHCGSEAEDANDKKQTCKIRHLNFLLESLKYVT